MNEENQDKCESGFERLSEQIKGVSKQKDEGVCDFTSTEMPKYKCIKEVWALKIARIILDSDLARFGNRGTDGSAILYPKNTLYAPFEVPADYVRKHDPQPGGYYVVYKGGYKSFSPAQAFEEGYIPV
jgi:hypothetical protein